MAQSGLHPLPSWEKEERGPDSRTAGSKPMVVASARRGLLKREGCEQWSWYMRGMDYDQSG